MSLPNEEWRPIEAHPGYYVSNLGRVLSTRQGKHHIMRPAAKRDRYLAVNLQTAGAHRNVKTRRVHQLVAEAFIGPRLPGMLVLHNDGTRTNNVASNLRYGTYSDNREDAIKHGVVPRNPAPPPPAPVGTHCKRGHLFEGRRWNGSQRCKTCDRAWHQRHSARKRAARLAEQTITEESA